MAEFIFHSEGKMLFGMPYVAKLHINDYYEIEKEFMLCNPVIDKDGDITVDIEYSAENFDIIEERHGSCNQSISATYNLIIIQYMFLCHIFYIFVNFLIIVFYIEAIHYFFIFI